MTHRFLSTTAAAVILAFAVGSPLQAAVLFTDNFNGRTNGSGDGNGNPAGTGNGSSSWGSSYEVPNFNRTGGAQFTVGDNTAFGLTGIATLMSGGIRTTTGYNAMLQSMNATALEVTFDFDRFSNPAATASNGFIGIGFGTRGIVNPPPATLGELAAQSTTTFGVIFQQGTTTNPNGNGQTFDASGSAALTNFNYGSDAASPLSLNSARIVLTPSSPGNFLSGVIGYEIFTNGVSRNSGTFNADGTDLSLLTFSSNTTTQRYIDNLTVTAVPEPTSLAALGIIGIAGGVRSYRRRRLQA